MKGVSLDHIEQIEYLFHKFREQNASDLDLDLSNVKKTNKQNIIDILLRYTNYNNVTSIDEILHYWKKFDEELEDNYVSKYCYRVLFEHSDMYQYNDFK